MAGFWAAVGNWIAANWPTILFVTSVAHQQRMARKARKAMAKAADDARGFQLIKEGEPQSVPVAYGRNMLGGIRVYHNTFNEYQFAEVDASGESFTASYEVTHILTTNERRLYAVSTQPQLEFATYGIPDQYSDGVLIPGTPETRIEGTMTTGTASTLGTTPAFWTASTNQGKDSTFTVNTTTVTWVSVAPSKIAGQYIYEVIGDYQPSGVNADKIIWRAPTTLQSFTPIVGDSATENLGTWRDDEVSATDTGNNKHEYLITQQVICHGGIERVYEVIVDERRIGGEYFDPVSNEVVYPYDEPGMTAAIIDSRLRAVPPTLAAAHPLRGSARVHVYKDGSIADPLAAANDDTRNDATFPSLAYATAAYKLNRENAQYNGVPTAQFFIEGMKVYDVERSGTEGAYTYALSSTKTYSNNSTRCLLDYLLSPTYGKGLTTDAIDLETFYKGIQICERDVTARIHPNATEPSPLRKDGIFWRAKQDKLGSVTRSIKLYECNLTIDTTKTIRDNIDVILDTMNDANLIWSGGKYKLMLEYPEVWNIDGEVGSAPYAKDVVVQHTELTSGRTSLYRSKIDANAWPPHDGTSVNANWEDIVKIEITDENIMRDGQLAISWPDAQSRYNFATVRFLNEAEDFKEDTVSWPDKIEPADGWVTNDCGEWYYRQYAAGDRVTYSSVVYTCTRDTLEDISPNLSANWVAGAGSFNGVYASYLEEDSGIQLETDLFLAGVTNYYAAKAHAEALVRTSRAQITYTLPLDRTYIEVEPGDVLRITSDVLNIPSDLVQVISINLDGSGIFNVSLKRFDARYFAWNVKDTELVAKRKIFDNEVAPVTDLAFSTTDVTSFAGLLSWTPSTENNVTGYAIKYTGPGVPTPDAVWTDIKTVDSRATNATIPFNIFDVFNLTVVTLTAAGETRKENWPVLQVDASLEQVDGTSIVFLDSNPAVAYTGGLLTWDNPADARVTSYSFYTTDDPTIDGSTVWTYQGNAQRAPGATTRVDVPALLTGDYYGMIASTSGLKMADRRGWPIFSMATNIVIGGGTGTIRLTTVPFPYFLFADGTTHTALAPGNVTITITAQLLGLSGTPTITAEAFNAASASLGAVTLGGSGLNRTITPAQFVAPGVSGSVRTVVVTATLGAASDTLTIYREDPTTSAPRIYLDNPFEPVPTDEQGDFGDYSGAHTLVEVYAAGVNVTSLWSFAITPDSGVTATINGGAGPVTGTGTVTVAVSDMTVPDGAVFIRATRATFADLTASFIVSKNEATGTFQVYWDPRSEVVLPLDINGNVSSYMDAYSSLVIQRAGGVVDTANWTFSKVDSNVTSTLTANRVDITSFLAAGSLGTAVHYDFTASLPTGWIRQNTMAYGNGVWIASGNTSTTTSKVLRSTDYVSWSVVDIGDSYTTTMCAYGNGVFIATGISEVNNKYRYSTDGGLNWSAGTFPTSFQRYGGGNGGSLAWVGDRFVIGQSGSTTAYWSTNGIAWTSFTLPNVNCAIRGVTGKWLAEDAFNNFYYSTNNGSSWAASSPAITGGSLGVVHYKGRWIIVPNWSATTTLKYSDNGTTWNSLTLPVLFLNGTSLGLLQIVNGVLFLSSNSTSDLMSTTDGVSWKVCSTAFNSSLFSGAGSQSSVDLQLSYIPSGKITGTIRFTKYPLLSTSDTEGFVTVTATQPGQLPVVRALPVRKGQITSSGFTFRAEPYTALFPATSDGLVTNYSGGVITAYATKDGIDDTANWTWTYTTTNLTPASGSSNVVTITNMLTAQDSGTITYTASRPGYQTITGTVVVRKVKGSDGSGVKFGAGYKIIDTTNTLVGVRFNTDGSVDIKRGSGGSYVRLTQYLGAVVTGAGNSYWMYIDPAPSTHALSTGTTDTWLQLNTARTFEMSDGTSGTHIFDAEVFIGTSSAGANAIAGSFSLKLIVP